MSISTFKGLRMIYTQAICRVWSGWSVHTLTSVIDIQGWPNGLWLREVDESSRSYPRDGISFLGLKVETTVYWIHGSSLLGTEKRKRLWAHLWLDLHIWYSNDTYRQVVWFFSFILDIVKSCTNGVGDPTLVACEKIHTCYLYILIFLPIKYAASKPVFCTVLSVLNVRRRVFPSEVIGCGTWLPQNVPWSLASESNPLRISIESYSQSCYIKKI